MQQIDNKSFIRHMTTATSLAALTAVSAALAQNAAQTVGGLDLRAVMARGAGQTKEAQSFVDGLTGKDAPYKVDAEDLQAKGQDALAKADRAALSTGAGGPVDFDELLKGAAANAATPMGEVPFFMVFASLSMPETALARLIADTSRAGGMVVFRGFPGGSASVFAAGLKRAVRSADEEAHIAIDPRLFRAFRVTAAPTFVVTGSPYELCDGLDCASTAPDHDRMTGNVTLAYALETFAARPGPGSGVARLALKRLEARP